MLCILCLNCYIVTLFIGSVEAQFHSFFTSSLNGGQWLTSGPGCFTLMKELHTHRIWGIVGSRAGLDVLKNRKLISRTGIRTQDRPDCSLENTTETGTIIDVCPPKWMRPTVYILLSDINIKSHPVSPLYVHFKVHDSLTHFILFTLHDDRRMYMIKCTTSENFPLRYFYTLATNKFFPYYHPLTTFVS